MDRNKLKDILVNKIPKGNTDDFERDAIEGFQKYPNSFGNLTSLDKRFYSKKLGITNWKTLVAITVGIFTLGLLVVLYMSPSEISNDTKPKTTETMVIIEEGDLIEENINNLESIAPALQITKANLPKISKIKRETLTEEKNTAIEIDALPIKQNLDLPTIKNVKIADNRFKAKEYYPEDFKLIDYRVYRDGNKIETKTLEFTGLSADKENENSKNDELVWKNIEIAYDEYIRKSMQIFEKGNFKKALSRYNTVLETYPDDINSLFYGGLCYYNLSDFDMAIQNLKKVKSHKYNNLDEEADWFIALSYIRQGEKVLAREALENILLENGFYADQAKIELQKLP